MGKQIEGAKKWSSKIIDIVSYALTMGVTCVFVVNVVYFRSYNTSQVACMYTTRVDHCYDILTFSSHFNL